MYSTFNLMNQTNLYYAPAFYAMDHKFWLETIIEHYCTSNNIKMYYKLRYVRLWITKVSSLLRQLHRSCYVSYAGSGATWLL